MILWSLPARTTLIQGSIIDPYILKWISDYVVIRLCVYPTMWISDYVDIRLCGYLTMWLSDYVYIRLCGYPTMWISYYVDIRICGYLTMRISYYEDFQLCRQSGQTLKLSYIHFRRSCSAIFSILFVHRTLTTHLFGSFRHSEKTLNFFVFSNIVIFHLEIVHRQSD